MLEAALIAAVLAPVALHPGIRRALGGLGLPLRVAVGAMVALTLAGQLVLDTRSFPFTNWHMYATLPHGDPSVYEYDAELRSGRRVPLVPGRFLGPESADRMMEALRRQVIAGAPAGALTVLAGMYSSRHPGDPVTAVVVSERTIAIRDGAKGPAHEVTRVAVAR